MPSFRVTATLRILGALILVVAVVHGVLELVPLRRLPLSAPWPALLESAVVAVVAAPVLWLLVLRPLLARGAEERQRAVSVMSAALDVVANNVLLLDSAGLIEWMNPAAARLTGFSLAEVKGRRPAVLQGDGAEPGFGDRLFETLGAGEPWRGEFHNRRKDGTPYVVDVVITPVRDEAGRVARFIAIGEDVTARHRAAEELQTRAAALDAAADAIVITDRELRIQWVNQAFTTLTGYALAEVAGQTTAILRDDARDGARFSDTAEHVAAGKLWRREVRNRRKDGTTYLADVSWTPVRDAQGTVVRFVGVGQDVTERRALETELRQAQKMEAVGELAGGIAHDFNNLLTTILASVGLLEGSIAEASPQREEVRLIRYSAERGAELTQKLLAFGRRQRLEMAALDLTGAVSGFTKIIRRVLREDIALSVVFETPVIALADPGAVEEILMNLATNARDAMPTGGRLTIAVERQHLDAEAAALHGCPAAGDYAVLSVTDTGTGMDAETQHRIFEPFFTTKPVGRGAGLGLSMVYGLVKQQGGGVSVYSEVFRGTTFRVYLPVAQAAVAPVARAAVREAPGGTETVLVVEDEVGLRRAAQRVLAKHGYTVLVAEDGVEALEILSRHEGHVALVVSDVVMPRMGGVQLYRALRDRGNYVPLLLTSGYTERDLQESSELARDVPFLVKPWTADDLLTHVRDLLDA